jgi:hypothetical protein
MPSKFPFSISPALSEIEAFNEKSVKIIAPLKSKNRDVFDTTTVKSTEAYDIKTGILNQSPEILLFTDFIPAYLDNGNKTDAGQIMEAKQESTFVNADNAINNILSTSIVDSLLSKLTDNQALINSFSTDTGKSLQGVVTEIVSLMKNLDVRSPFNEQTLIDMGFEDSSKFGYPYPIETVLLMGSRYKLWTVTKTWIQMCLQLKDVLLYGVEKYSQLPVNADGIEKYNDPYSIMPPATKGFERYHLRRPVKFFNIFGTSLSIDSVNARINNLKSFYQHSRIYNQHRNLSDAEKIESYIAQKAILLCKEYSFSKALASNNTIGSVNYTLKKQGNHELWDYVIGQAGEDITDINPNPLGGGNSFISLCQHQQIENSEPVNILSFESTYIDDNIGQNIGGVLTPGLVYYVESTLGDLAPFAGATDTTRISSLKSKFTRATQSAQLIKNMLPTPIVPDDILDKGDNPIISFNKYLKKRNTEQLKPPAPEVLGNPALLIQTIKSMMGGNKLLDRNKSPAFIQGTEQNPASILDDFGLRALPSGQDIATIPVNEDTQFDQDISTILINYAVRDHHFKSYLFMYVLMISGFESEESGITFVNKPIVLQKIINDMVHHLAADPESTEYKQGEQILDFKKKTSFTHVSLNRILSEQKNEKIQLLKKIASFIKGIIENSNIFIKDPSVVDFMLSADNNPFSQSDTVIAGDQMVTTYTGINKSSYVAAVFELICECIWLACPYEFLAHKVTTEPGLFIAGVTAAGSTIFYVQKVKDTLAGYKTATRYVKKGQPFEIFDGLERSNVYNFDIVLTEAEKIIFSQNERLHKHVNTFFVFLKNALTAIENFEKNVSNKYVEQATLLNEVIQDPSLTRMIMQQKQLSLITSKLFDIKARTESGYESPIKHVVPYFLSVKDNPNFENLLPLEDVDLCTWRLFLDNFLKRGTYREQQGFNKKILSVGLPQGLYRKISVNDDSLNFANVRNDIVNLYVYKINMLVPNIVYKPKQFLFDLRVFPTKVLANYTNAEDILNKKKEINFEEIPFLIADSNYSSYRLAANKAELFDERYNIINVFDKEVLYSCHVESLMLEAYIKYLSGVKVDEHRYVRYDALRQYIDSTYSQFLSKIGNTNFNSQVEQQKLTRKSVNNFFINDTLLVEDLNEFKKTLITPRKFDRVFHVCVDPDEFEVDVEKTQDPGPTSDGISVAQLVAQGYLYQSSPGRYHDVPSQKNKMSFDRYYVLIDTLDEANVEINPDVSLEEGY